MESNFRLSSKRFEEKRNSGRIGKNQKKVISNMIDHKNKNQSLVDLINQKLEFMSERKREDQSKKRVRNKSKLTSITSRTSKRNQSFLISGKNNSKRHSRNNTENNAGGKQNMVLTLFHKDKQKQLRRNTQLAPIQINMPIIEEGVDLGSENVNKLHSFIRGAYQDEYEECSNVINLDALDRFREEFYTFNNLYYKVVEENLHNKMSFKDVKKQSLRDIVFLNEHKDQLTTALMKKFMGKLNVVQ